jgi:hypothetical protein
LLVRSGFGHPQEFQEQVQVLVMRLVVDHGRVLLVRLVVDHAAQGRRRQAGEGVILLSIGAQAAAPPSPYA